MGSITDQQNVATMNTVVDAPNMEEDLQKANVAEMQLTIKRLEEQIVHLQANASDVKNEQLDALQAKIEASSAGERQWQQKHADLESRYQLLEKDILQIREGIPDTLPKQMQAIKTFRARIIDLEKEGKYLSESTSAFEKRVTEATRAISKDGATLDAFEKEYAVQQERINRLEDITKIQLHDINRLLIEANYLNGINNKSGSNLDDAPGMSE
jgi:chromosome segregation ATPase